MPAKPLLQHDFEDSVGCWVCMAAHLLQRALNEELAPHGITYRQWQVLAWLALEGQLSQSELAERMDVEPATVVSVLARMERDGWIRREECPLDKRKRLVCATEAARPVWEKGIACAQRVRARATANFDAQELDLIKRLMSRMKANLSAAPARRNGRLAESVS